MKEKIITVDNSLRLWMSIKAKRINILFSHVSGLINRETSVLSKKKIELMWHFLEQNWG